MNSFASSGVRVFFGGSGNFFSAFGGLGPNGGSLRPPAGRGRGSNEGGGVDGSVDWGREKEILSTPLRLGMSLK